MDYRLVPGVSERKRVFILSLLKVQHIKRPITIEVMGRLKNLGVYAAYSYGRVKLDAPYGKLGEDASALV